MSWDGLGGLAATGLAGLALLAATGLAAPPNVGHEHREKPGQCCEPAESSDAHCEEAVLVSVVRIGADVGGPSGIQVLDEVGPVRPEQAEYRPARPDAHVVLDKYSRGNGCKKSTSVGVDRGNSCVQVGCARRQAGGRKGEGD